MKEDNFCFKVRILWEYYHEIRNKLPLILKLLSDVKTKWEIFFKFLWLSQNILTLQLLIYEAFMTWFPPFRIFMRWSNENNKIFSIGHKKNNPTPFWLVKEMWNFKFGIGKTMSWALHNSYVFSQIPKSGANTNWISQRILCA